jgi:hypothetical protein
MDTLQAKEKFSFNLLHPTERAFDVTVMFIVYKTIERNNSITLNQLKWLLQTEYMLDGQVVDGAVASLTSKTLFNSVSRWALSGKTPVNGNRAQQAKRNAGTVHLRAKTEDSPEFTKWLERAMQEYPEFAHFQPPVFTPKQPSTSAPQSKLA